MQFTTKDKTHVMENDRFLVLKKVAIEKLPEQMTDLLDIDDKQPT